MRRLVCFFRGHAWKRMPVGVVQRHGFRARQVFGCARCKLTKVAE